MEPKHIAIAIAKDCIVMAERIAIGVQEHITIVVEHTAVMEQIVAVRLGGMEPVLGEMPLVWRSHQNRRENHCQTVFVRLMILIA